MSNIVFIGIACVLLRAYDVYHPTPAERVHVVEVPQGDEVKGTTVPIHTVVHRRLTNAWSGSTASKLTAKGEGDRVQEAQAAQETFRGGFPVSSGDVKAGGASVPAAS